MATRTAAYVLKHTFGYDTFRGFQAEVIEHVNRGGDALVLMPTGGGKSLTYQIPAMLRLGVGVVVSPLSGECVPANWIWSTSRPSG